MTSESLRLLRFRGRGVLEQMLQLRRSGAAGGPASSWWYQQGLHG